MAISKSAAEHRLLDKDIDTGKGVCLTCGPVQVKVYKNGRGNKGPIYRCPNRSTAFHNERKSDKTYLARNLRNSAMQRSKARGTPFHISADDVLDVWADECPICKVPMSASIRPNLELRDRSYSLDQVIPGVGYVAGNIAVICWRCNNIKGQGLADDHARIADWMKSHGNPNGSN